MNSMKDHFNSVDADNLVSLLSAVDRASSMDDSLSIAAGINFLRNFTIEGIEPYLKYHLYSAGIKPKINFGGYGTIRQEIFDGSSFIYASAAEIIVLSLVLEELDPQVLFPGWLAKTAKNEVIALFDLAASKTSALIAVNTFAPAFYSEKGIASSLSDKREEIIALNMAIRDYVKSNPDRFILIDWERFIDLLGEDRAMDYRYWYISKAPFKKDFLNLYAKEIVKAVKALKGYSKKCLVLDCDNTLWGGIIGEDELFGIKLDRNEYPGKAYYDFQASILHLFERGVLLTLCSKNNEDDVWNVLDNHHSSLIKRSHLAGWRINWENKVDNIVSLAKELNIGLDSLVLVEDSPTECELVRRYLPEVAVLPVPDKLYAYPQLLLKDGLFDTLRVSKEDKTRTRMYQTENERRIEKARFKDLDEYLASLDMVAEIRPAKEADISRIAQLTQKTNQFNLTTRRYSEKEIDGFRVDSNKAVYTLTVKDKFGDYGLTGVFIAKREDEGGLIDTLLLSCRILGRRLESVFVDHCLKNLEGRWRIIRWKAEYIPTKKNGQVVDFLKKSGFIDSDEGAGSGVYFKNKGGARPKNVDFIKIIGE